MSRRCPRCHLSWGNYSTKIMLCVSDTARFPWSAQRTMFTTLFDLFLGTKDELSGAGSPQMCVYILGSSWCYNFLIFFSILTDANTVREGNTGCITQYEFTACVCVICVNDCRKHTGCSVMYVQLSFLHTVWVHWSPGCCDTLYVSLWLSLF